ncbi:N(G),N(G)-dimethylarginine dimethylaminohydrolase [bacterium]|nr:N(G),N(G)-dimethylarginine dimethylaminohydrolase [bacterium]
MIFRNAITRKPGSEMIAGITTANLGAPDYTNALRQHEAYVASLEQCGVAVTVMEHDPRFPDGMFVEDTAVLSGEMAVITNPGAGPRKGEEAAVRTVLETFFTSIDTITAPGTLEGGDVMQVEDHFYIGLSERTNRKGAEQFITILEKHGYTGSTVTMTEMLHLKTGVAWLGGGVLLAAGEFVSHPDFAQYVKIEIPVNEMYAANCIRVNDYVIVPAGFPETAEHIRAAGFSVISVDVSEFRKLDGGLSCLSLRF